MLASKVFFIFFKFKQKDDTLHLVFTDEHEKSNHINISSPIDQIVFIENNEYEIITRSKSHYSITLGKEIISKYNKELEIFHKLMKN